MRLGVLAAVLGIAAAGATARADDNANLLVGPVFGIRVGHHPQGESIGVIGIEGGAGFASERINLGFEHRADRTTGYVELDPWLLIGGTLGVGITDEGRAVPVLGVWEGVPLTSGDGSCTGNAWHTELTLAAGYRYIGVHELYFTFKAGAMQGRVCLQD